MKATSLLAAAALGLSAFSARADLTFTYTLMAGGAMTQELQCLPPCTCEYHRWTGPMTGTFTITRVVQGPLFDEYAVMNVNFTAMLNGQKVSLLGTGRYTIGGDFVIQHQLKLNLMVDGVPQFYDSGMVMTDPQRPFPQIGISVPATVGCGVNTLTVLAVQGNGVCYANCDGSTMPPVLTVNDFTCFLSMFAQGSPYANCDGSASEPVLNVNDFVCFLNSFTAGCT